MLELICHLLGDYTFQTSWMARNKVSCWFVAIVHATVYTFMFVLILQPSLTAILVIGVTHCVIDRLQLARYWTTFIGQKGLPVWLGTWLLIINDNIIHLVINHVALYCWP